jgi:hypothetical protein
MSAAMKALANIHLRLTVQSVNSDSTQRQGPMFTLNPFQQAVLAAISVSATVPPYAINHPLYNLEDCNNG